MSKGQTSTWSDAALAVWAVLGDRPVSYHPALARALGNDVNAALFLGQLMYWSDKGTWKPGWVAKTQTEIYQETALTRSQQERVRRKLIKLGILSEKLMDVPARLYFRVHFANLSKLLVKFLHSAPEPDCGKPAHKDAEKPQTKAAKPASQNAEKQQSIPENTTQTTTQTTPEKSGAMAPHSVLDAVFPESTGLRGSADRAPAGNTDDLTVDEKAQIAENGPGQRRANMDLVQAAWYNTARNITFPFGLSWVHIHDYAVQFSELFGIPVPSAKNTIGQWRRGIVDIFIAFADELHQAGEPRKSDQIIRRATWAMQVFHARRAAGQDWLFDVVSPISISNTLRVIAGDLRAMQTLYDIESETMPTRDVIIGYYSTLPYKLRGGLSGSDQTEQAILELEAAGATLTMGVS